ncbi:Crp/Fnr family transcriptional regulator [Epilithonimonas ginsengisoli]|uniref:Crp/Fnr family transcriptional regulator n=1 Tax=Epilithonimonas ginsengisoli TaxID=1245592 RepID=A0ABU4JHR8_9FLAO|nr:MULTISPECIES: Crp/Fnr family transcriptional regulator [Chryseobacterium group]MBV6880687.1 Crp/Fnr family transcriptional regulator [Epilithonimonas sp. FP105]MDW8549232.1 Crp/Fnr family transcriptional regulator [Epilithonimonas ginsengisoli]OAH70344.1 cyclic nucleotide-binding protein [Chryseobacterium sp. FP211-J200]
MSQIFRNHLEKFIKINDDDFEKIFSYFEVKTFANKEDLLEEGQVCRHNYFVLKGLLRKFFINEKGTEQTTDFALESWWMTDNFSFEHKSPSDFSIQAVEKSEVLVISNDAQEKLLEELPVMEKYFRIVYQRAFAANQRRVKYIFSFSKEEFYLNLLKKYPDFVQRVPQYLIASFLGFTPEYLSELRKKIVS